MGKGGGGCNGEAGWGSLLALKIQPRMKAIFHEWMNSLIAATAIHHQLTLVTRDAGDFPDDVVISNPWEA
jgi:hypothetical protein